jgi:cytochrome bd ubiquinol oxidase subunit II
VTPATLVAMAMFLGVIIYALLAGADFGSGFYDLTAGNAQQGARIRTLVDHSIGPVWEANHVWLIYILVIWWTGFPAAFAAATTTLFIPMALALAGIVLRGASFAFRKYSASLSQARIFGAIFAGSSLIGPFFLGCVAGAIASGRVPAGGYGDRLGSWLNATSLVGGALAVATSVFLAGVFLTADAARAGDSGLADSLRARTMGVGVCTGLVVFAGLYPVARDAPTLASGLRGHAAPLLVLAALAGLAALVLLYRRRYSIARFPAAAAVGSVITGWGIGQYPWILVGTMTVDDAAGAAATLTGLLIVVVLAGVIVLPALGYLLWLTQSEEWTGRTTAP